MSVNIEMKAQVDGILSDPAYMNRTFNRVHELIGGEPSILLRFIRESDDYVLSTSKSGINVSLKTRLDKSMEEEEERLTEAMGKEEGSEDSEEVSGVARLEPIRQLKKRSVPWKDVSNNISECHMILARTSFLLGSNKERIKVEQLLRDLETIHNEVCLLKSS